MRSLRVYVDASVIGGCLDEEFAAESRALLAMARAGEVVLLVSDLLIEELSRAPSEITRIVADLPRRPCTKSSVRPIRGGCCTPIWTPAS